jgi:hypothetical protein
MMRIVIGCIGLHGGSFAIRKEMGNGVMRADNHPVGNPKRKV